MRARSWPLLPRGHEVESISHRRPEWSRLLQHANRVEVQSLDYYRMLTITGAVSTAMNTVWGDLFTPRQLVALTTFSDLVQEARERVKQDALTAGMADDGWDWTLAAPARRHMRMRCGVSWRSVSASRPIPTHSVTLDVWQIERRRRPALCRQALPMAWDFVKGNPFAVADWQTF